MSRWFSAEICAYSDGYYLSHASQKGMMWNVLHIQSISKKHVSIGHVVDHGMQVCFTNHECFIEEEGQIIAQGHHEGRMFIIDINDVDTALFVKG